MKAYIIMANQCIPPFGYGMGRIEFVCTSLKKAMEQMDALVKLNEENNLFVKDPEKQYIHKLIYDGTFEVDVFQQRYREIAIEHWLNNVKTSTTYYTLIIREVNNGLIVP